jgi:hypothetical protein
MTSGEAGTQVAVRTSASYGEAYAIARCDDDIAITHTRLEATRQDSASSLGEALWPLRPNLHSESVARGAAALGWARSW